MSYRLRIFSKTKPEGVEIAGRRALSMLSEEIVAEVEDGDGVYRGPCPCCSKPIVVRRAGASMTAGDEHFLLHDGGTP